jgi:hypothetical protein
MQQRHDTQPLFETRAAAITSRQRQIYVLAKMLGMKKQRVHMRRRRPSQAMHVGDDGRRKEK